MEEDPTVFRLKPFMGACHNPGMESPGNRFELLGRGSERVVLTSYDSRLGEKECQELLAQIEEVVRDAASRELQINLTRTTYADSQGLKLFVSAERLSTEHDTQIEFRVSPNLYNILRIVNLAQTLNLPIEVEDDD